MKRLYPILLAGLMLLGAACAGPEGGETSQTAYQRLSLASQKLEATSAAIDMDITLDMTQGSRLSPTRPYPARLPWRPRGRRPAFP